MKASKPVLSVLSLLVALTPIATYARGGNPVGSLDFTETSSTELTAKLGGFTPVGTVSNLGQDEWEWDSGVVGNPGPSIAVFWQEPGNETGLNELTSTTLQNGNFGFLIRSDVQVAGVTGLPNGSFGDILTLFDANGSIIFGPAQLRFNDTGDGRSVPESASTFGMLFAAALAFLGLARLRDVRASQSYTR